MDYFSALAEFFWMFISARLGRIVAGIAFTLSGLILKLVASFVDSFAVPNLFSILISNSIVSGITKAY